MNKKNGFFITFEGIDGCGKSTQAEELAAWLRDEGHEVLLTFEPGGWPGDGDAGKRLRELILSGTIGDVRAEFLLFLADRSAHSSRVIEPALSSGKTVICERWSDSTLAYQCGGRGFSEEDAEAVLSACRFREPDLTILLDISPEEAAARLAKRGRIDGIESEGLGFMRRTADAYLRTAKRFHDRIAVVPAFASRQETAERIRRIVMLRTDGERP